MIYKCKFCNEEFGMRKRVRDHIKNDHHEEFAMKVGGPRIEKDGPLSDLYERSN